jgi:hypothetical protein
MNIDEIRLLQYGDILRGEQGSSLDPITDSGTCPFEVFASNLKTWLLQAHYETGEIKISQYLGIIRGILSFEIEESEAMSLLDAISGLKRFSYVKTGNQTIDLLENSVCIGSSKGFKLIEDVELSLLSDLDEGSVASDTAYNIWFGEDNEEIALGKFSLLTTPPSGMYSAVCVGFIATDSSSYIKNFIIKNGFYLPEIPVSKSMANDSSSPPSELDFSAEFTDNFVGLFSTNSSNDAKYSIFPQSEILSSIPTARNRGIGAFFAPNVFEYYQSVNGTNCVFEGVQIWQ